MTPSPNPLSDQDSYMLARAFVGLPWADLPASAAARLLLSNVDMSVPDDVNALRRVLGPEALHAVLSMDPNGPSPEDLTAGRHRYRAGTTHRRPSECGPAAAGG